MSSSARPLTIGAVRFPGVPSLLESARSRLAGHGISLASERRLMPDQEALCAGLLDGSIDLGITAIDDWPLHLPFGVALAAVCERQDPFDALLTRPPQTLGSLPEGATVYAHRAARFAQLIRHRPDLMILPDSGPPGQDVLDNPPDAIVLPMRDLEELDARQWSIARLDPEIMLPPPLQGILVVLAREDAGALLGSIRDSLHQPLVAAAAAAEAGFRAALAAEEDAPLAALATWADEGEGGAVWMDLTVRILSPDGSQLLEGVTSERVNSEQHGRDLGAALALDLVGQGALDLLDLSRG